MASQLSGCGCGMDAPDAPVTTVSSSIHLKHFKQSRVLHFSSYNNSLKITVSFENFT